MLNGEVGQVSGRVREGVMSGRIEYSGGVGLRFSQLCVDFENLQHPRGEDSGGEGENYNADWQWTGVSRARNGLLLKRVA